jgi:hypothetical protein
MSDDEGILISPAWTWRVTNYSMLPEQNETEPAKALSWVRCSVEGQTGTIVQLIAEDPAADQEILGAEIGSRPDYGPYFCELGPVKAGWYTLKVEGLDVALTIWLDGSASATVTLVPIDSSMPLKPVEKLPHVLLLNQLMGNKGNFLALTRYVARFGAVVTFDPDEAAQAEHVILVGSTHLVSKAVEQRLLKAGICVERVQGDIAAQLDGAIELGTPFLST